jgi:formylglycine-generating enzyme required for sulfatase activity/ankyrin repeat protein
MYVQRWIPFAACFLAVAMRLWASGGAEIGVVSNPSGADVYKEARRSGQTPCAITVTDGARIFVALSGYEVAWSTVKNPGTDYTKDKPLSFTLRRASSGYNQERGIVDVMRAATGDYRLASDWAIYEARISALEYIRSLGMSFSGRELQGTNASTPLLLAIDYEKPEIVDWLIAHGALVDLVTFTSPLERAMERGRSDIVVKLKAAGARADAAMLFRSAASGSANVVNRLISAENLGINVRDSSGRTPLMIAALAGNQQVVAELILLRADVTLRDNDRLTASDHAQANLRRKMTEKNTATADESWPETAIVKLIGGAGEKSIASGPAPMSAFLDLVKVDGDTFTMGDGVGDGFPDELPARSVAVSGFYLSKYEITFEQYDQFCNQTGRQIASDEGWGRGNRPAINVRWLDAAAFCNWLSDREGLTPFYAFSGTTATMNWRADGYRLPTEAEWEFAARGGRLSRGARFAGSVTADSVAWYATNSGCRTQPRAGKQPNELGLYDMSGNVAEWCNDWSGSYSTAGASDPRGPSTGLYRILRGGSWAESMDLLRMCCRAWSSPETGNPDVGFRPLRPVNTPQ